MMKHIHTIVLLLLMQLPLGSMAQSLTIVEEFKIIENSSALVAYYNQFGDYEKPAMDDTFPYAVVRVLLEGNAHEVTAAKKMLGVYTGLFSEGVKASYLDFENEILFLVPSSSGHVELSCGEGCARQIILELPKLQSNAVYVGKVHYTPAEIMNTDNIIELQKLNKFAIDSFSVEGLNVEHVRIRKNGNTFVFTYNLKKNSSVSLYMAIDDHRAFDLIHDVHGAIGETVVAGNNLQITWNMQDSFEELTASKLHFRLDAYEKFPKNKVKIGDLFYSAFGDGHSVEIVSELKRFPYNKVNRQKEELIIPSVITYKGYQYRVESIGNYAFFYCEKLATMLIPEEVTHIGENAFMYCSNLSSITLSDNITHIGNKAFYGCEKLQTITLPTHLNNISENLFYGCESLSSIVIPEGVEEIGKYAFVYCENLLSISLPKSIKYIRCNAFERCKKLSNIHIPDGITRIEKGVFWACKNLVDIKIPHSVKSIDSMAFGYCNNLTKMVIPNSVIQIGDQAFEHCKNLSSITIPSSVTNIGKEAFYGCKNLTSIILPNSVTNIKEGTFTFCENLQNITIPNSVTHIGDEAFSYCKNLCTITLPSSVTNIGDEVFYECKNLSSIIIPKNVKHVGTDIFDNCDKLTSIAVERGNKVYDSRENCNAIVETKNNALIAGCQNTIIPHSINIIANKAFRGCDNLPNLTIPNSVKIIGKEAFWGCNFTSITIPSSVIDIEREAFSANFKLKAIYVPHGMKSKFAKMDGLKYLGSKIIEQ